MNTGFSPRQPDLTPPVWAVGALARAVADALDARFNPVAVRGEVSGFARAASGHCYFTLKDVSGQLRCAMFRRAASLLSFAPREGDQVELRARLSVYEARGDLQLVVESMTRAGQGALFEQFLRLKARLEAEGLFDAGRKRALPAQPRGIGIVTSRGAAALHDVLTALARRVPHIPVLLAPAPVQGEGAAQALRESLSKLYLLAQNGSGLEANLANNPPTPPIDLILLVRGGGSIEDLWAFNDEQLARTIAASPVPVIAGIGHETDFTIADFVADLRAPAPTAAAELASAPRVQRLAELQAFEDRLRGALQRRLDAEAQRVDRLAARLGRPSGAVAAEQLRLVRWGQRLQHAGAVRLQQEQGRLARAAERLPAALQRALQAQQQRLERAELRLGLLDPRLVLERGYAWLQDEAGRPLTRARQAQAGQALAATLADGMVEMTVTGRRLR
ncbi:MAG: exodeoxyribonuclease VII large subunit [Burkholderiaceae bacterium]